MDEKRCGRCAEVKPVSEFNRNRYSKGGLRSQCRTCMKEERLRLRDRYKEWRSTPERRAWYAQYRKDHYDPVKTKARNLVSRAIKRGELVRGPCEKCGDPKTEAHHDDYTQPLVVRWLCDTHHKHHHHGEVEQSGSSSAS